MAEDGRPSERGHCPALLPLAMFKTFWLLLTHPGVWREVWKETNR